MRSPPKSAKIRRWRFLSKNLSIKRNACWLTTMHCLQHQHLLPRPTQRQLQTHLMKSLPQSLPMMSLLQLQRHRIQFQPLLQPQFMYRLHHLYTPILSHLTKSQLIKLREVVDLFRVLASDSLSPMVDFNDDQSLPLGNKEDFKDNLWKSERAICDNRLKPR